MNKISFKLLSIPFLLTLSQGIAQDVMSITGKIIDERNGTPLSYAAISLKGTGMGTVANNDGEFEFHTTKQHLGDTLQISTLGYTAGEITISSIEHGKPFIVRLKESPVQLQEVVVTANSISANEIFRKAFDHLTKTFPQENYLLKGFYRQINTENGKNVFLEEASVNIFDKKTQLNNNFRLHEKVAVNQMRVSNSFFKNTDPNYFENSNTLTWLLLFDYTKHKNKYVMERTNFVLDSIVNFNQHPFYVISSKADGKVLKNKFTLYIDTEDFSFLKIKNETVANKGYYVQNFDVFTDNEKTKVLKLTATSQTYQFEKYKRVMFLKHAHSYNEGEIINTKTSTIEWKVTDENLLVINEVTTDNVRAPELFLMDNGKNIKFLARNYDAKFWNDFKLVNLTPLTKKQRSDLEETVPLEEQFKNQSIKK